MGRFALNPVRRSPRNANQQTMTGMAKNDRKNTASPGGTTEELALINEAMTVNRMTAVNFSAMARSGDMGTPTGMRRHWTRSPAASIARLKPEGPRGSTSVSTKRALERAIRGRRSAVAPCHYDSRDQGARSASRFWRAVADLRHRVGLPGRLALSTVTPFFPSRTYALNF